MEEPAPRMFWPREIWGKYAASLDEFKAPANRTAALQCLNEMVRSAFFCFDRLQAATHFIRHHQTTHTHNN